MNDAGVWTRFCGARPSVHPGVLPPFLPQGCATRADSAGPVSHSACPPSPRALVPSRPHMPPARADTQHPNITRKARVAARVVCVYRGAGHRGFALQRTHWRAGKRQSSVSGCRQGGRGKSCSSIRGSTSPARNLPTKSSVRHPAVLPGHPPRSPDRRPSSSLPANRTLPPAHPTFAQP